MLVHDNLFLLQRVRSLAGRMKERPPELVVDELLHKLVRALTVQEARLAQAARAFQFDASLAPYNLAMLQQWRSLSRCITAALIQKVAPVNGASLSVTTEADPSERGPRTAAEERLAQQLQSKASVTPVLPKSASGAANGSSNGNSAGQPVSTQPALKVAPESCDVVETEQTCLQQPSVETGSKASHARPGAEGKLSPSGAERMEQQHASHSGRGVGRCFYTRVPKSLTVSHVGTAVAVIAVLQTDG